jgi:hypothetical protein
MPPRHPQRPLDRVTEASADAVEQLSDAAATATGASQRVNNSLRHGSDQILLVFLIGRRIASPRP